MIDRLKIRIRNIDESIANELIKTAQDRIKLRVGLFDQSFPSQLDSICVEVVAAMYRRQEMKHEGTDSESVDGFSIKFVDDLLKQYDQELIEFKRLLKNEEDSSRSKVRFL